MLNELGKQLISGIQTLDNCYGLVPDAMIVCNNIRMPNEDLWHQRMGHSSYKQLSIVSRNEAVLRMPKLGKVVNVVCGPCQLGKQTKAQHHGTLTTTTTKALELLHIDLMGLTKMESLGGRKYIMVVVDDFTKFTWVILRRSKFEARSAVKAHRWRRQRHKARSTAPAGPGRPAPRARRQSRLGQIAWRRAA